MTTFEWDPIKASVNLSKHGVSFEEASTIFEPAKPAILEDLRYSGDEARFIGIGFSEKSRLLTVSFTWRGPVMRLISARRSDKYEVEVYAKAKRQES